MMQKCWKKTVWILALIMFAAFMILSGWFLGRPMIALASEPEKFRAWVDASGGWGRILFVGMVAFQVLVAFIPGEPVELAAGYAFGVVEGTVLTLGGFLLGSWAVFALVRRFGTALVEVFFTEKQIRGHGFLKNPQKTRIVALLLMLIPGTPKDFLSYFAGLTDLTTVQWLGIVAVGRIPSLITSVVTGAAAGEKNYVLSGVMLAVTLVISMLGIACYRRICRQENQEESI